MKLNEQELKNMIQNSLQKAFSKNMMSLDGSNDSITSNVLAMNKAKNMAEEEVEEEKGYSPFLKSDENPKGETEGLTMDVLNQILMKIVQDEEGIGGETTEATSAGGSGSFEGPLFTEPKKNMLFQPGTETKITTKPEGGPVNEGELRDFEKQELVRKLMSAAGGPSPSKSIRRILDDLERKLQKGRASGVKYVRGVKVDEQESEDVETIPTEEDDTQFDFYKGVYEPDTKTYVGSYLVGEETPKQLEVYNIIERPDRDAIFVSNHVPYSMSLHKVKLPLSQIEILGDVPGKEGFKFIRMPYWFFKKNDGLRIQRLNEKKALYLKGRDRTPEALEKLFDPMFEKYFEQIVYDEVDQKKYDIAKSNHRHFNKPMNEDKIPGGKADGMDIEDIAKMHDMGVDEIYDEFTKGVQHEMEHTSEMMVAIEIALDHLYEDPQYYTKLDKMEHGGETTEATTSASAGVYDAPFGGPKKDPLKLSNPDTVEKELRSVRDKNFPKFGGKGGKYVKVKKKCSKFPYCNQGDINALQIFERDIVKEMITNTAKKTNLEEYVIRNIVAKELGYIQEQEDGEYVTFEFPDDYKPKSAEEHQKEWLEAVPDKKAQFLIKELKDKEFEFNANNGLSGKVKILDVGPEGKIGGFFGSASDYDFGDSNYAELWVELSDLKFKGQTVPVGFYDMISRYLPPEEEEDSYRGDPVESAIMHNMEYVERVMKSLGLHLVGIRINPYARFR